MSENPPRNGEVPDDDAQPLIGEPAEPAPMRLRAEPPRVTRLSRKVLAGLGLVASVGLGGALIYALQTRDGGRSQPPMALQASRAITAGCHSSARRFPTISAGRSSAPRIVGRLFRSRASLRPIRASARKSSAAFRKSRPRAPAVSSPDWEAGAPAAAGAVPEPPPQPDLASLGLASPPATPSAQDRQNAFLNAAADRRTVAPDRVAAPASPNILQAGAVISAALITGIRSDLPGQITAQVTENIYDSPTGRILLVPQGTRVIGQYANKVQFGQNRVLLVWNRLIFPNGRSIVLDREPGADAEGYAGSISLREEPDRPS